MKGDKKLVEGQFKFELKEGDKVVETATNAADGTVTFKAIKYNEAGKHTYTITEVDSKEENVTYDTAKHEVTVEVVDNGTGQLVTTVTGNNPTFTNTYTEPKKKNLRKVLRVNNLRKICQTLVEQTLQHSLLFLV